MRTRSLVIIIPGVLRSTTELESGGSEIGIRDLSTTTEKSKELWPKQLKVYLLKWMTFPLRFDD